jgi:predicted nucleic acid-binding protein
MIYLDSSVALSALLAERRAPLASFWTSALIASRLLEYETMTRIHLRALGAPGVAAARKLFDGLTFVEMTPDVLARALAPFPIHVRARDVLHLATTDYPRAGGKSINLATYDKRFAAAAAALGFSLVAI